MSTKATSPSENFSVWYHSCGYTNSIAHPPLTFEVWAAVWAGYWHCTTLKVWLSKKDARKDANFIAWFDVVLTWAIESRTSMKSYQPLSCLFSELWTAPRFQVSPRLRKVEGRDQPRGQSLSPEASQEEWWPFWSPERAISSAFQQNVSISRYFFQTILPRRFFLVRPTCFRLEWNLNLFWWCTCCFFLSTQRNEKEEILSMRLEFPSRESNLSIHHLEKGPIFWIRSVYFKEAEKLTVLKKMDSFCQQEQRLSGFIVHTFYVSFLFPPIQFFNMRMK